MISKRKIRFAFTIQEGRNAGLTSGSWFVKTHVEDVYIAGKAISGIWKVSLHGDQAWRLALTSEHVKTGEPPQLPNELDRAGWTFQPPPFVDGRRLAFAIAATRGALLPIGLDEQDLHIAVEDRWDQLTVAYLWMTEPAVELDRPARRIGEPLLLASGRRVWLTAGVERVAGEPEPIAVGSMVEPMTQDAHGVTAPGLMLKGVRLQLPTGQ